MITLKQYLSEAAADESKLKHLEHAEDHVINEGDAGFSHAYHNLVDTHNQLTGQKNNTTIMTKYDGSPSVVFGRDPKTNKFFVGSKSVFNVSPKLNFTPEDIDRNHGHAPGLAAKLKTALEHLPKVTPKKGIFQGDIMHSGVKSDENPGGDVDFKHGKLHFTPNTITYATPLGSEEGSKLAKSKLGVVVHTSYEGDSLESMKPNYAPNLNGFNEHPGVHMIDNRNDVQNAKITDKQKQEFKQHLGNAVQAFNSAPRNFHSAIEPHEEHLKTYMNSTVRDGSTPSLEGYKQHIKDKFTKAIGKVKTEKSINAKQAEMQEHLDHVDKHENQFQSTLDMHRHLQAAKDVLVHALSSSQKFEHSIKGQKSKPEGYVTVRNNRPTKLVDRAEFSRANFLARA